PRAIGSKSMSDALVIQHLDLVSDTLSTAQTAIGAGHLVDMNGLDRAVGELCVAAAALPPPFHGRAARRLSRLAQDLSALAAALTPERESSERAPAGEARQRAQAAYANAPTAMETP